MRMLQPSPGEAVDRQTILQLKCQHGQKKGVNVKPFVDENNALQEYLEKNWLLLTQKSMQDPYDRLWAALKEVNKRLWDLEDEIRLLKSSLTKLPGVHQSQMSAREMACLISGNIQNISCMRIIEIGLLVPELNDRRAQLVQELNALFGIRTQEKLYVA